MAQHDKAHSFESPLRSDGTSSNSPVSASDRSSSGETHDSMSKALRDATTQDISISSLAAASAPLPDTPTTDATASAVLRYNLHNKPSMEQGGGVSSLALTSAALQSPDTEPQAPTAMSAQPCFLGLSVELRLDIYELVLDYDTDQEMYLISPYQSRRPYRESPPILQMSLTDLAMTCKLIASEIRACRNGLKAEERFAAIKMSSENGNLCNPCLQRAPCSFTDLTKLKITLNVEMTTHPLLWGATKNEGSELRYVLMDMLDDPDACGFAESATNLRDVEIYIQVKCYRRLALVDEAAFEQTLQEREILMADYLDRRTFSDESSMGIEGFRCVRVVESVVLYR